MDERYDLPPGVRLRDLVRVERSTAGKTRIESLTICRFEADAPATPAETWRRHDGGPWQRVEEFQPRG